MTPQSADELVENFRMAMSPSMRGDLGFDPDDLALDFTFDDHLEHIIGMVGVREDLVDPLFELIDIATSSSVKNTEKAEHLRQALDSFDLDKSGYSSLASSYNEAYGMIVDGLSPHYEAAQNLYKLPNGLIVNRDGVIVDDSLQAIAQEAYLSLREVASPVDKMIQMAPDDSNGSDMLSIANIVLREIQKKAAAVAGAVGLGAGTASAGNVPYDIDEVLEKDKTSLLNPFGLSGNSQSIEETFGPELRTKLHDTTVFLKQVTGGALAAVLGAPADLFNTSVQAGHTLVGTLKDVVHGEEFEKALKARYRQSGKLPYLLKNHTSEAILMALRKGLPSAFAMEDRDLTESEFWISLIPALVSPMRQGGILPKKGKGGYLVGPSHENGGIDLGVLSGVRHEAEGGEYIIRKDSVDRLGVGTLDYLNQTGRLPKNRKFVLGGLYPWAGHTEPAPNAMEVITPEAIEVGVTKGMKAAIPMLSSTMTTLSVAEANRMSKAETQDTVVSAYAEVLVRTGELTRELQQSWADMRSNKLRGRDYPNRVEPETALTLHGGGGGDTYKQMLIKRNQEKASQRGLEILRHEENALRESSRDRFNQSEYDKIGKLEAASRTSNFLELKSLQIKDKKERAAAYARSRDADRFHHGRNRARVQGAEITAKHRIELNSKGNRTQDYENFFVKEFDLLGESVEGVIKEFDELSNSSKSLLAGISEFEGSEITGAQLKEMIELYRDTKATHENMVKSRRNSGDQISQVDMQISLEKEAELAANASTLNSLIKKIQEEQGVDKDLLFSVNQIKDKDLRMKARQELADGVFANPEELLNKVRNDLAEEANSFVADRDLGKKQLAAGNVASMEREIEFQEKGFLEQAILNTAEAFNNANFSDIIPALKKKFSDTVETISDKIRDAFTGSDGVVSLGALLKNTANFAGNQLMATGKSFGRGGKFVGDAIGGALTGDVSKIGDAVSEFVLGNKRVQKTMEKFGKVITRILDPLAQAFLPVIEALGEMFTDLAKAIEPLMPIIIEFAGALTNLIKLISSISVPVIGGISSVVGGIFDGIMSIGSAVGNVVKSIPVIGNVFGGLFGSGGKRKSMDDLRFESIVDSINEYNEEQEKKKRVSEWDAVEKKFEELFKDIAEINDPTLRGRAESMVKNIIATERLTTATESLEETMRETTERIAEAALTLGISYESLDNLLKTGTTSTTYQDSGSASTTGRSAGERLIVLMALMPRIWWGK